jgi:phosphatidylglycerophosphate synthase
MCPPAAHPSAMRDSSGGATREPSLAYTVEDRSLATPVYRRFVVTPCLRFIPARVDPNSITHVGHILNLLGMAVLVCLWPQSGWPYVAAAIGVHLYNFCDNADGAHARRTGQCSAKGEFLDHGLDMLNTTYIAFMSAVGVGAPATWSLAIVVVMCGAACATYWEQAETGVFHLGAVNQIESVFLLSAVLVTTAIFGQGVWDRVALGPVTMRLVVMGGVTSLVAVGVLHGMGRVMKARGASRVLAFVPLVLFDAAMAIALAAGAMAPLAAIIVVTVANVYFGLRMLSMRLAGTRPKVEIGLVVGSLLIGALIAWRASGRAVGLVTDVSYASVALIVFGGLALFNARDGVRRVERIDRASATAAAS